MTKRIVFLIASLVCVASAFADAPPYRRNDSGATINPNDLQPGSAAVKSNGDLLIDKIRTPISVNTPTANWPVLPQAVATPAFSYGTLAFGSVTTASFTTLVTNAGSGKNLEITNLLDVPVLVSIDATNNSFTVAASSVLVIDLKNQGLLINSNISVKAIGTNAASGNIYGTVMY